MYNAQIRQQVAKAFTILILIISLGSLSYLTLALSAPRFDMRTATVEEIKAERSILQNALDKQLQKVQDAQEKVLLFDRDFAELLGKMDAHDKYDSYINSRSNWKVEIDFSSDF